LAAERRIVAVLGVENHGEESVLVGHAFRTWLTVSVLGAAAALLLFVEREVEGLLIESAGARQEEEAAALADFLLSRSPEQMAAVEVVRA
jgi:hypothetical protein